MKKIILWWLAACILLAPVTVLSQTENPSANITITQVYRYDMQVVRISGQWLTVDIEGFGRKRFRVPRDFTFDIDGEKHILNQLRTGQRLRAYVTQTKTGDLFLLEEEHSGEGVMAESVQAENREDQPAAADGGGDN